GTKLDAALISENAIGTALGTAIVQLSSAIGSGSHDGADAPATRSFGLGLASEGVASGLHTSAGDNVLLYSDGAGGIIGRTAGGATVLELGVDPSTGALTVTMLAALSHAVGTDVLYMNSNVLFATVTLTDADGDVSTAQLDVKSLVGFGD